MNWPRKDVDRDFGEGTLRVGTHDTNTRGAMQAMNPIIGWGNRGFACIKRRCLRAQKVETKIPGKAPTDSAYPGN